MRLKEHLSKGGISMKVNTKMKWVCAGTALALSLIASPLVAWQRSAAKQCTKDAKVCAKPKELCKYAKEQCLKDAPSKDEESFSYHLSPYARSLFVQFDEKDKQRALDFADKNRMKPDDAVFKVDGGN